MRTVCVLMLLGGVALASGCARQEMQTGPAGLVDTVERDGLAVTIESSQPTVRAGEELRLVVTVRNTTRRAVRIDARSGAPVYLRLWRNAGLYWNQVKRYPEAATMILSPWSLPARQQRQFVLALPVEPDWPTGESLKITAEINGRPELEPSVRVIVHPPIRP